MRKCFLPENGKAFKANLHCHTNISDGALSARELKRLYRLRGYSVVAFTDHDVMVAHEELADADFLPLRGYEMEFKAERRGESCAPQCHLGLIALSRDARQVCFHRTKYLYGNAAANAHLALYDAREPDFERTYTAECINEVIARAKKAGFFVTLNHPEWSLEGHDELAAREGLSAVEVSNYNCKLLGFDGGSHIYDELLRSGKRLFAIAADDDHNAAPPAAKNFDSFGAFTVIRARELSYEAIAEALEKGWFYASEGPEIRALFAEDGKLHVRCSGAESVAFTTRGRHAARVVRQGFEPLTEACFEPSRGDGYVRVIVTDRNGRRAYSNACFTDEFC